MPASAETTSAGQPLARHEPVVERGVRQRASTISPATASDSGDDPGAERARAEAPLELGVAAPDGVGAQEHGRQVGAR